MATADRHDDHDGGHGQRTKAQQAHAPDFAFGIEEEHQILDPSSGALTRTCYEETLRDEPPLLLSTMVLRASKWQATRFGLEAQLVDSRSGEVVPLPEMARRLLAYLRPSLEEEGDWEQVCELVDRILVDGNGALRQRRALHAAGGFAAVLEAIATRAAA